jgi:hypothetical protein
MPLLYRHIIPKHLLPQLIQCAVIVVPHISEGLPKLLADFHECITVEEVEAQSFTLVLRQRFKNLIQTITPKDGFWGIIALYGRISDHMIRRVLNLRPRIELAGSQITAPLNGPMVCHLDDPGACGGFGAVKDPAFALEEEEQVLDEILCFRGIPQYASCDAANDARISFKQTSERRLIAPGNACHEHFICQFDSSWLNTRSLTALPSDERQGWKPRCGEETQISSR